MSLSIPVALSQSLFNELKGFLKMTVVSQSYAKQYKGARSFLVFE